MINLVVFYGKGGKRAYESPDGKNLLSMDTRTFMEVTGALPSFKVLGKGKMASCKPYSKRIDPRAQLVIVKAIVC